MALGGGVLPLLQDLGAIGQGQNHPLWSRMYGLMMLSQLGLVGSGSSWSRMSCLGPPVDPLVPQVVMKLRLPRRRCATPREGHDV